MTRRALWISLLVVVGACTTEGVPDDTAVAAEEIVIGPIGGGGQCGTNSCGRGTFCCNASCGVCAPIGGACLDVYCDPAEVSLPDSELEEMVIVGGIGGQQCGYVTCGKGQHCCNASCSKCVPFGMECTQQSCD